uniref:MFS domain-containing protein n=1 Tax=Parastrongyloides trichosuri TaxID=131310 RepID=A0A0N4ZAN7_PARTI
MDEHQKTGECTSFRSFRLREWIIVSVLILANIVSPMTVSCILPFFVDVGNSKGLSLTLEGIVFAVFNLWTFLTSPFVGRMIPIFGVKFVYTLGLASLSIGTFIFATTNMITSGGFFFITTCILRIVQSMGNAMLFTTTYAIASKDFPNLMSTILGLTETGTGIGYTIGPVVGGFLYQYIGYPYPFLILGSIASVTAVIAFFSISSNSNDKNLKKNNKEETKNERHLTWLEMIKIKDILCMLYTLIITGIANSFHDATLAIGCKQFNLSSGHVGLLFLSINGAYSICAPIMGHVIDKYSYINDYIFILGYILQIVAFVCMGPAPFLNYKPTVLIFAICLIITGFAFSTLLIPSFKKCMDIVIKEHGFTDSLQTSATVSGVYISSYFFGCFIGPFVGSALVEYMGYRETLSLLAALYFVSVVMDEHSTFQHESFRTFHLREWIILSVLVLANIVSPMAFSCISPFFDDVGNSKNVSLTMDGIVFAIFNFTGFILSPFVGKIIPILGVRNIYSLGMVFLSVGTLLFSLTNFIHSSTWFFISTLALRIIQSIGNAMTFTTTYAIAAKDFPKLMSTMLGLTETGAGIGYTVGPVIGGFLYEYVGYPSPFLILGVISFITAVVAFFFISSHSSDNILKNNNNIDRENIKYERHLTWYEIVKIKDIWCIIYTLILIGVMFSFHDSTLAIGCKQFDLSSSDVGLLFLCIGGLYALFAPIWGYVIDKYPIITDFLFLGGYILQTLAFSCMGPVPFFNYEPSVALYAVCLIVMGFGASMLFVPSFKQCMDIVIKEHHFADSLQTSSVVSGLFGSSFCLGAFLGPLVGSAMVENLGYKESLSIIAVLCFVSMILFTVTYIIPRFIKKWNRRFKIYETNF